MTGILPVALDESTKVTSALLEGGKEYISVMLLHDDINHEKIIKVFKEFTGEIFQRPPLRSSVKRRVRTRTIYYNWVLEVERHAALVQIGCQSGTYIRKIAHDIGEVLECGAHMAQLRRIRAGPFIEDETLVTLHDLSDAYSYWQEKDDESMLRKAIQPIESSIALISKIHIKDSAVNAICHGAHLTLPGIVRLDSNINVGDTIAVLSLKGELVAFGRAQMESNKMLSSDRGIAVKTERVIMPVETYPKCW